MTGFLSLIMEPIRQCLRTVSERSRAGYSYLPGVVDVGGLQQQRISYQVPTCQERSCSYLSGECCSTTKRK